MCLQRSTSPLLYRAFISLVYKKVSVILLKICCYLLCLSRENKQTNGLKRQGLIVSEQSLPLELCYELLWINTCIGNYFTPPMLQPDPT